MWALIMTVYLTNSNAMQPLISTLDNFQSEQACRYAGAKQELQLREEFKISTNGRYTFICVKKGE